MNNIVDFPTKEKETNERETLNNRRREAIKKLSKYRGEVQSKNTIRQLPDVEVGQIFWVEMDNKAYIVAEKSAKKMTIKALDENASISTGMTIFEMNKSIISKEPVFDWTNEEAVNELENRVSKWFNEEARSQYYLLYGRDIHYVSLFNVEKRGDNMEYSVGAHATQDIRNVLGAIGEVISFDFNTASGEVCIEIWIRTADSKAELLYMFPYDNGLIKI